MVRVNGILLISMLLILAASALAIPVGMQGTTPSVQDPSAPTTNAGDTGSLITDTGSTTIITVPTVPTDTDTPSISNAGDVLKTPSDKRVRKKKVVIEVALGTEISLPPVPEGRPPKTFHTGVSGYHPCPFAIYGDDMSSIYDCFTPPSERPEKAVGGSAQSSGIAPPVEKCYYNTFTKVNSCSTTPSDPVDPVDPTGEDTLLLSPEPSGGSPLYAFNPLWTSKTVQPAIAPAPVIETPAVSQPAPATSANEGSLENNTPLEPSADAPVDGNPITGFLTQAGAPLVGGLIVLLALGLLWRGTRKK